MNIDESKIIEDENVELALACLLAAKVCDLSEVDIVRFNNTTDWATSIYVNANDIFAWALADSQNIRGSEILDLYKLWKENSEWASVRWLCLKRNMQPQNPVKQMMIKENAWDETLEALAENGYDKAWRLNPPKNKTP